MCQYFITTKYNKFYFKENKMRNQTISKRLRKIYENMKQRCYYPKDKAYKYYGGKGVIICDEWLNDKNKFFEWALNNGYQENLTIDRKEIDGDYEPDNCRWITHREQQSNRSNNVFIEIDGEIKTICQWSQETGIGFETLNRRLKNGEDINKDYFIKIKIDEKMKTLKELSEESGIPYKTLLDRYHAGWNLENLLDEPRENKIKYIEINGEIHTAAEWAKISGLTKAIILNRIQYGWKNEDLIKPRTKKGSKKYIEIDGEFHTIDEWCEIMNIHRNTFYYRLKKLKQKTMK